MGVAARKEHDAEGVMPQGWEVGGDGCAGSRVQMLRVSSVGWAGRGAGGRGTA